MSARGSPLGGYTATIITIAAIVASGFLAANSYFTGHETFTNAITLSNGQLNYSGHITTLPLTTGTACQANQTGNCGVDNISINGLSRNSFGTLANLTTTNNQTFLGKLNLTGTSALAPLNIRSSVATPSNLKSGDCYVDDISAFKLKCKIGATLYNIAANSANNVWTGVNSFKASADFLLQDITDTTKQLQFVLSAITTGHTVTWTVPNINGTVAFEPVTNATTPVNQTGTSSLTQVMYGSYITITPKTTNVLIQVTGGAADSTLADGCRIEIREGTSNLGANGAAASGTLIGNNLKSISATANQIQPFHIDYPVTGLSANTKIYVDLTQAAITGGTCTITNVKWFLMEY